MWLRSITCLTLIAGLYFMPLGPKLVASADAIQHAAGRDGIVRVPSTYSLEETLSRVKADIAAKNILLFDDIDQSKLAADAGIELHPSHLIVFGNPPLGTLFITADAEAGLDWPVRLLVYQDDKGKVWMAYSDFQWIAKRHRISNRKKEFNMAAAVIASIVSSAEEK
ncbi:MAG: DUF302 domain-containing protein [Hyphomicrobiaceae bacterium]